LNELDLLLLLLPFFFLFLGSPFNQHLFLQYPIKLIVFDVIVVLEHLFKQVSAKRVVGLRLEGQFI
jgi:hypothetical protein